MNQREHYDRAEALLDAGVKTVQRISSVADTRKQYNRSEPEYREGTEMMDELGKKAMGIWAQAQVHATLAANPLSPRPAGRVDL